MNLVMTLVVHNERETLETLLAYHRARGVDFFLATDRKSDDGSLELLRRWEAAGRLRLLREDVDSFDQGGWVTRMARLASREHGADWVIHGDCDEFFWPVEGDLKTVLAGVAADVGIVSVERTNFAPRPEARGDGPFWQRLLLRETRSTNPVGRPLPPKAIHRGFAHAEVQHGNHHLIGEGYGRCEPSDRIEVLHFPMRSYQQFERKITSGARVMLATPDLPPGVGRTWIHLYELWQAGRLREYWDERVVADEDVERALAAGTHVIDRRLADFLRGLSGAEEEIILVDEDDNEIGYAEKHAAHRDGGRLHRAFSIFLFDAEGRTLLQRRAASKYHFGGLWTNACCSHPRRGEALADAVHRRLREELGCDTDLREVGAFVYTATDPRSGLTEREYDHVFVGDFEGEPRPAPEEVDAVRWASAAEVERELARHPERFTPWFAEAFAHAHAARRR